MNGLIIINALDGVNYHRLLIPWVALARTHPVKINIFLSGLDDKGEETINGMDWKGFDFAVFNRNLSPKLEPEIHFVKARLAGVKMICDIDDNPDLNRQHPLYRYTKKLNMNGCIKANLRLSQGLTVSTKLLKNHLGLEATVCKNAIDPDEDQFQTDQVAFTPDRFFWLGGITHEKDLQILRNESFTVVGYTASPEWEKIRAKLPHCRFQAGAKITEYAKKIWDKGPALVPLVSNQFNRCKSPLKIAEAGHFSKPVIVSDTPPYNGVVKHGINGLVAKDTEWGKMMQLYRNNPRMMEDHRHKLNEDCAKWFNLAKENEKRWNLLQKLLKQ